MNVEKITENNNKLDFTKEDVIRTLVNKRRVVLIFMVVFFIFSLLFLLLRTKEYTSSAIIIPQIDSSRGVSQKYSKIAALAGINLNKGQENLNILPTTYPIIISSTPFLKEMLQTPLTVKGQDSTVTLSYYLTEIKTTPFLDVVAKYTIGLPALIVSSFMANDQFYIDVKSDSTLYILSASELSQIAFVNNALSVNYNDIEGYIEVSAVMPQPLASAELARAAHELLQKYIIEYNIQKSKDELDFIEKRMKEVETDFFAKREIVGNYKERNLNIASSISRNKEKQYEFEYDLAFSLYSDLASQFESAKLQVKKDTPIFTIVKPVTLPEKSSSKSAVLIIIGYLFLGGFLGIMWVLYRGFAKSMKNYLFNL
jgi:Zn-dependent protease with chaperone function